jgi:hypothetical protein
MSEPRITEAQLLAFYEQNRGLPQSNTYSLAVMQLIAEVRRLRGVIVAFTEGSDQGSDGSAPEDDYGCVFCSARLLDQPHKENCPWPALETEARAIREEQKP